ncbi:MAG: CCDC90 family protein [Desulfovibrio sp.]|jgi:hypothetical protein|nr:CCDC90 family protein [Desulfovibrio sp.]
MSTISAAPESAQYAPPVMFDTLRYAKRLQEIGLPREQAEGFAELQREIMDERLATKTDILRLETVIKRLEESTKTEILRLETVIKRLEESTKTDILRLETVIKRLEESTKTEILRLETVIKRLEESTKTEIKRFETEIELKFKVIDARFDNLESRLTVKLGSIVVGAAAVIVALNKLL